MKTRSPKLNAIEAIIAVKGLMLSPFVFINSGGIVETVSIHPALPAGLALSIENESVVLSGRPLQASSRAHYTITVANSSGDNTLLFELAVVEAPIKEQRGAIIVVHDARHDLDTPRSQIANAMNDAAMMGNHIKPHEKFSHQPMGDDKRLSNQTANNPDAENRAQQSPELTPSPSAKLQQQAVARATPQMTPKPGG